MRWNISIVRTAEQRRQILAQTKKKKDCWGVCAIPSSPPFPEHAHTGTRSLHKHALAYTRRQTLPPTPRGDIFYILAFLVDCRCSAINSPLIEAKKQQQEEKALIPEKQLRDPVDKAVFPKPQQRETPDITQALSNSKRYLLNWSTSCVFTTRTMHPLVTPISNICCNMLFGNPAIHADTAALHIYRAENLPT